MQLACVAMLVLVFASHVNVLPMQHTLNGPDFMNARVPYILPVPGTDTIADAIRARRGNGVLSYLDGVLLHDPSLAAGWSDLLGAIRNNSSLPASMRELFILRTATLNNAAYVWLKHEPVGRSAGLTVLQLREIRLARAFSAEHLRSLTPEFKAAMLFTDFMTKRVQVPQPIFDGLHRFLDDKQMVDAVATVGGYNFVSRFVVALNVDGKMDMLVPVPMD